MKQQSKLRIGEINHSGELGLFECLLAQESGREVLRNFDISTVLGESLDVTWNTNPDAPPDIVAWGFGFEITKFPPDNAALFADTIRRFQQGKPTGGVVPAFSKTLGAIRSIRKERDDPNSATNSPYQFTKYADEVFALKNCFNGLRPYKDVPVNHVLLLDATDLFIKNRDIEAVEIALREKTPVCWKLVVIVDKNQSIRIFPK